MKNQKTIEIMPEHYQLISRYYEMAKDAIDQSPTELTKGIVDASRLGYSTGTIKDVTGSTDRPLLTQVGILDDQGEDVFKGRLISPVFDFNEQLVNLVGIGLEEEKALLTIASIHNARGCRLHSELHVFHTVRQCLSIDSDNAISFLNGITMDTLTLMKSYGVTTLRFHYDDPEHIALCKPYFQILSSDEQAPYQLPEALQQVSKESFIIRFEQREYLLSAIDRKGGKLKATVKVTDGKSSRFHLDTINFASHAQVKQLSKDICRELKFKAQDVTADIHKLIPIIENYKLDNSTLDPSLMTEDEKVEALNFAKSSDLIEKIRNDLSLLTVGESLNSFICYLAATSRIFEKPLAVGITSTSGSGKSALVENTLKFFPEEEILYLSSLSPKALFYRKESLNNKIISLEEMDGVSDDYALRVLVSSGKLVSESTMRNPADGAMGNCHNYIEAKSSLFVTSTKNLHSETASRLVMLTLDQSAEQTKLINQSHLNRRSLSSFNNESRITQATRLHANFHRLLRPLKVYHSPELQEKISFDSKRIESRRNLPKLTTLIDTIALLRQYQKQVHEDYIIADLSDWAYAQEIADKLFKNSLATELSANAREMMTTIENMYGTEGDFSRLDLAESSMFSMSKTKRTVSELLNFELILPVDARKSRGVKYTLQKTLKEIS